MKGRALGIKRRLAPLVPGPKEMCVRWRGSGGGALTAQYAAPKLSTRDLDRWRAEVAETAAARPLSQVLSARDLDRLRTVAANPAEERPPPSGGAGAEEKGAAALPGPPPAASLPAACEWRAAPPEDWVWWELLSELGWGLHSDVRISPEKASAFFAQKRPGFFLWLGRQAEALPADAPLGLRLHCVALGHRWYRACLDTPALATFLLSESQPHVDLAKLFEAHRPEKTPRSRGAANAEGPFGAHP